MALFQNISMDQLLSTWAANAGPTEEEKIAYANAVSDMLDDSEMVKKFIENVNQVGVWANEIDESFDKVTRSFADMVNKYGSSLPEIKNYHSEWIGYNNVGCFISLHALVVSDVPVYSAGSPTSLSRCCV